MKDLGFLKNQLFSHRGIFDNIRIYENTIGAFTRALKYNFGIELDVKLTLDNQVVVFHDDNTERLLHVDGSIEAMTYDELCYIAKFQIPLLSEVLELINGAVPILIELKSNHKKYDLLIELVKILDEYQGDFAIQSFYTKSLKWLYKNRPNYITGYIVGLRNYKKDPFFKKYGFVNLKINSIREHKIKYYRERYIVIGWNVETKEDYEKNEYLYDSLVCDNILEIKKD